jgi:hypothetical protein
MSIRFNLQSNTKSECSSYSLVKPLIINTFNITSYCIVNSVTEESLDLQEIAVVCFEGYFSEEPSPVSYTLRSVLIFISVFFILLTLYVYYLLPELRETQDKVTIFTLINLATFLFFLAILQLDSVYYMFPEGCIILAFLVFFFSIAYFSWLNCTIANVWKIIV